MAKKTGKSKAPAKKAAQVETAAKESVAVAAPAPKAKKPTKTAVDAEMLLKKTKSGRIEKPAKKQSKAKKDAEPENESDSDELKDIKVVMPEDASDEDLDEDMDVNNDDEDDDVADEDLLRGIDDEALEDPAEIQTSDEFVGGDNLVLLRKDDVEELRKATADVRKSSSKRKASAPKERGVIYLGRIPHGFYEREMRSYFSQFGDVLRLRLSRNKKTGRSRHYAFIEFKDKEVAKIVAETMDNYLMFNHILKCKVVPAESLHPDTFKNSHRKFRVVPRSKIQMRQQNKPKSVDQWKSNTKKLVKKEEMKRKQLAELGIDYQFPGYTKAAEEAGVLPKPEIKKNAKKSKSSKSDQQKETKIETEKSESKVASNKQVEKTTIESNSAKKTENKKNGTKKENQSKVAKKQKK